VNKRKQPGLIYNRIKDFRKSAGLTQEDAARQSSVHMLPFSKAERGITNPRLATKKKLATFFNTTIEYLFPVDGEGQPLLREDVDRKEEEVIAA
jgi:transcriptional regulator with XRE-family HTH domain